jgi:hypothetical protein
MESDKNEKKETVENQGLMSHDGYVFSTLWI